MSRRNRILLYVLFGFFSLGVSALLTFPFQTLRRRIETELAQAMPGASLTIDKIGPSLPLGLYMGDLVLNMPGSDPDSSTKIQIDSVRVRPAWLKLMTMKPAVAFSIGAFAGNVSGEAWSSGDTSHLDVTAADVHLEEGGTLEKIAGVQFQGTVKAHVNAVLGPAAVKGAPPAITDGVITASVDSAHLKGGKVMGFTVPATDLGTPEVEINIVKGEAKIEKLRTKSSDIDVNVTGGVSMRSNLVQSPVHGNAKIKLTDAWLARNPTLKGAMSLAGSMRKPDGSLEVPLNGTLGSPISLPGGGFPRF